MFIATTTRGSNPEAEGRNPKLEPPSASGFGLLSAFDLRPSAFGLQSGAFGYKHGAPDGALHLVTAVPLINTGMRLRSGWHQFDS